MPFEDDFRFTSGESETQDDFGTAHPVLGQAACQYAEHNHPLPAGRFMPRSLGQGCLALLSVL
ncbi:MAG TPA: hypothetical protein QGG93_01080 [Verrucomicrobiota bacterium]|nr:hypothetical protein [Verrucomicrobiota bacterium]